MGNAEKTYPRRRHQWHNKKKGPIFLVFEKKPEKYPADAQDLRRNYHERTQKSKIDS
jgi:hypothetical protein